MIFLSPLRRDMNNSWEYRKSVSIHNETGCSMTSIGFCQTKKGGGQIGSLAVMWVFF